MRILITGGAGFIGSHVADAYCERGHEVMILDSLWEHGGGLLENVPAGAQFVQMDVRDRSIAEVFRDFKPEIVNHHAAQHSVAIGSRDPAYDAEVNVLGLLNLLRNAVATGTQKVIFASSGATFGTPGRLPIDERTPQRPESPYGITKLASEYYLRFYEREHGLRFTALRYGNVYGPRQDPNGEAGVVAIFIGKFLQGSSVRIDSDGEQTRDYVFVKDVADANVKALDHGNEAYCIGTNTRTSVNTIYRTLCEIGGFEPPVEHGPRRPGDARDAQFDPALARAELQWQPATTLSEGLQQTYRYFSDRLRQ